MDATRDCKTGCIAAQVQHACCHSKLNLLYKTGVIGWAGSTKHSTGRTCAWYGHGARVASTHTGWCPHAHTQPAHNCRPKGTKLNYINSMPIRVAVTMTVGRGWVVRCSTTTSHRVWKACDCPLSILNAALLLHMQVVVDPYQARPKEGGGHSIRRVAVRRSTRCNCTKVHHRRRAVGETTSCAQLSRYAAANDNALQAPGRGTASIVRSTIVIQQLPPASTSAA